MPHFRSLNDVALPARISDALQELPCPARNYGDTAALDRLTEHLAAVIEWTKSLTAKTPSRLLVAGVIEPQQVAEVFAEVESLCSQAFPPRTDSTPSSDAAEWQEKRPRPQVRADRLIHLLRLISDQIRGTWSWVPSVHPVSPDGTFDDNIAWEKEYSPSSKDLSGLAESLAFLGSDGKQTVDRRDQIYGTISSLTESAASALESTLDDGRYAALAVAAEGSAAPAQQMHLDFLASVKEVKLAASHGTRWAKPWWVSQHNKMARLSTSWIELVPAGLPISRAKRQAVRRDVLVATGYVLQYTLLQRGSAATYDLLQMAAVLSAICEKLVEALSGLRQDLSCAPEVSERVRLALGRRLVSAETVQGWRVALGDRAQGVGRLVKEVVARAGQSSPLPQGDLLGRAGEIGLLTAQSPRARQDAMFHLLVRMQNEGLAAKIPAKALPESDGGKAFHGPQRKHLHLAREWWLNPLGAILTLPSE